MVVNMKFLFLSRRDFEELCRSSPVVGRPRCSLPAPLFKHSVYCSGSTVLSERRNEFLFHDWSWPDTCSSLRRNLNGTVHSNRLQHSPVAAAPVSAQTAYFISSHDEISLTRISFARATASKIFPKDHSNDPIVSRI